MSTPDDLHVITLADRNYAMPLAVMGRSLLENHRSGRMLTITVIDGGITVLDRVRIERSWHGASPSPAQWRFVPPAFGNAQALPVWGRVPKLTYARIALNDYYDGAVRRAVVLDSDTLVLTDIARLHDLELADSVLGACVDPFIPTVSAIDGLSKWRELGLNGSTSYFNAGVMVVRLDAWRSLEVARRALEYIAREVHHLRQYDQDGLNAVLAGCWTRLDDRWQTHPRLRHSLGGAMPADPWIIHFSGRLKPWIYRASSRADALFFEYLDRTAWRSMRPKPSLAAWAYSLYDSPLRWILYPIEKRASAWKRALELGLASRSKPTFKA